MGLKGREVSYFDYSLFLATVLSLVTLVITLLAPSLDLRLIYLFFYYLFFNFTFLLCLAFVANYKPLILKHNVTKVLFIPATIVYSLFYLASSFSFLRSGQTIKLQGIYFAHQITPFRTTLLLGVGIFLLILVMTFLVGKWVKFKRVKGSGMVLVRIIFMVCLVSLIASIFYFSPLFGIENPLIRVYLDGHGILIHPEIIPPEPLLNVSTSLNKPNVIFILLESVSDYRVSYYGYKREVTPNIDALAEKGIVFKNSYAVSTHSDYAQPAYLSSRHVLENNYRTFYNENLNRTFVWDIFAREGYTTGYISSQDDSWANMEGYFDYSNLDYRWYSLTDGETDYGSGLGKKDYDHKTMNVALDWLNDTFMDCRKYETFTMNGTLYVNQSHCLDYGFDENAPFFLYMNLQGTHLPLSYDSNYSYYLPDDPGFGNANYDNRYDNSLRYVDAQLGRLLDYLEEEEVMNNTVLILSSDHGHDTGQVHDVSGHGLTIYNDELKVPLIFYFPDLPHQEIEESVSNLNVVPTVLDIMGLEGDENFRGKPFPKEDRLIFYAQNHKYLIGMIKENLKIILDLNRAMVEVYDIKEDPSESVNLLRFGNYDSEILELLLWHNCQLNYFSVEDKPAELKAYCEAF